jgi:hypothetical protein
MENSHWFCQNDNANEAWWGIAGGRVVEPHYIKGKLSGR